MEEWTKPLQDVIAMPANQHIALYLISLLQEGKSSHVIQSTLYAIKWHHDVCGLVDPTGTFCKNMLECAKRIATPKRQRKEPLTPLHLKLICNLINRENADLLNLRKSTMLLVSFAGFLRFSGVDKLMRGDVHFFRTHVKF